MQQIYEFCERNQTTFSLDGVKKIVSNIDICSILNEKEYEGIGKMKTIIEPKQHNGHSKV